MKNEKVMKRMEQGAYRILTCWAKDIHISYYEGPYYKRSYGLHAYHSWGTAYCDWSWLKNDLKRMLRECGATNIVGTVKWNRVELYFDLKKRLPKEEN